MGKQNSFDTRRQLLINKGFQLRFLAFCGLTALIACAAFYGATLYYFTNVTGLASKIGVPPNNPVFLLLYKLQDTLTLIFGFVSLAIVGFTTVAGLMFSNRIAGPLYRLKNHFEKVARGETMGDIEFRQKDYFPELADSYNKQMQSLRGKFGSGVHGDIKKAG